MKGVNISKKSMDMYRTSHQFRAERVFVAVGMKDPFFGPRAMRKLAKMRKNRCYYVEIDEAGNFLQEWGVEVARLAIEVFNSRGRLMV
jgi:haloalkane dehalogenase